ncbi:MAG: PfkB family carbohydrate kinase, partial [Verrucomicrobiales bacterium]|nr:PfkB family carbohydrate kinase [Verrucomicrobiales bacterium]
MLLVAGEALIDLLPVEGVEEGSAGGVLEPAVGGSPFNVALAAGRLGLKTRFLNRISLDGFGERLAGALEESGVDLGLCPRVEALTTLGMVRFPKGDGVAEYAFYTQGTAGVGPEEEDLPAALPEEVGMVHVGSFALAVERVGPVLEVLLEMAGRGRLVSFDLNVRAFLVEDEAGYRARVERVLDRAEVVKVSDEDLEWLVPGVEVDAWVAGC